eukprot:3166572-Pyramimonas_sp.AAC.1
MATQSQRQQVHCQHIIRSSAHACGPRSTRTVHGQRTVTTVNAYNCHGCHQSSPAATPADCKARRTKGRRSKHTANKRDRVSLNS